MLQSEIVIERPRAEVWRAFFNRDNAKRWLPQLVEVVSLSGQPFQPGSTSRVVVRANNQFIEMIATVIDRIEPNFYQVEYDSRSFQQTAIYRFDDLGYSTTSLTIEVEIRYKGFTKLIGWMFLGMARRQGYQDLLRFKTMLEAGELEV